MLQLDFVTTMRVANINSYCIIIPVLWLKLCKLILILKLHLFVFKIIIINFFAEISIVISWLLSFFNFFKF